MPQQGTEGVEEGVPTHQGGTLARASARWGQLGLWRKKRTLWVVDGAGLGVQGELAGSRNLFHGQIAVGVQLETDLRVRQGMDEGSRDRMC